MAREELRKEGLFITEFSDAFFSELIQENGDLKSYIQKISDKVSYLQERGENRIWHCIFSELIKDQYPNGLGEYFEFAQEDLKYPDFHNILVNFYTDPVFLTWDIAQKITYNLCRLNETGEYDMDDESDFEILEDYGVNAFVSIGRQIYEGSLENGICSNTNEKRKYDKKGEKKDLRTDLILDLKKLEERYAGYWQKRNLAVYFPQIVKENKLILENDLIPLNLLYSCNEKFQRFLYHLNYDSKCFNMLNDQIGLLNKYTEEPIHYIWEKMTSYNTIFIIAKLIMELTIKEGLRTKKEKSIFIEYIIKDRLQYLFRQIRCMPNVLTRLLFLKIAFNYIMNKPREVVYDYLDKTTEFLASVNVLYQKLQESLLAMAVMVRWHMGKKRNNRIKWMSELEKEYDIDIFRMWMLSLNISNGIVNQNLRFNEITREDLIQDVTWALYSNYKAGGRTTQDMIEFVSKVRLLEKMEKNKYIFNSKNLADILQKEGWVDLESVMMKASVQKEDYEDIPLAKISVDTYSDEELKEGTGEEWIGSTNHIEDVIRHWLLSEYKKVVFETNVDDDNVTLKNILKFLLYHFFV